MTRRERTGEARAKLQAEAPRAPQRKLPLRARAGDAALDVVAWLAWKVARLCALLGTPLVFVGRWSVVLMLTAQRAKKLRAYRRYT